MKNIKESVYTEKDRIADYARRANAEHYNWDKLIDFIVGWEYDAIANNLLHLYFLITHYYVRDNEVSGKSEELSSALYDLKELHLAIKAIGEKEKGILRLTSDTNTNRE